MKRNLTPIASGVALFLMGAALSAQAQEAPIEKVQITGIRASLQASLSQKRNAETHVDVITAEDIGKMPDKNVADSLQRVPGVTISSAGATEGGFDENDRVSMRGTNPSLTQTLINGHLIGSGDWFVLNQSGAVGRSVSYSLMPSELVGKVVIHKSAQASLVEGGVAGNVDVITRKPLEFKKAITLEGSLGVVYADLPSKVDPQLSGLFNWKSSGGTVGVLVQAFAQRRHLRRDGQEILGYDTVAAGNAALTTNPDLLGVYYPRAMGSALFEQERKRVGGLIDLQIKPSNAVTLNFDAFASKMDAPNYNRNYLLFNPFLLGNGQAPLPGYTIRNGTLVQADFAARTGGGPTGLYDEISRPESKSSSNYFNFDAAWRVTENLTLTSKLGVSKGTGETPTQDVVEWDTGHGAGASWTLNGVGGADWNQGATVTSAPAATLAVDWIFGFQNVKSDDKETYGQIDGEYALGGGLFTGLKFGARFTKHERSVLGTVAQGPLAGAFVAANFPTAYSNYPGDFADGIGGTFPRNVYFHSAADLAAFNAAYTNRDPVTRAFPQNDYIVEEKTNAAYFQGDFKGEGYSGNVGVRFVQTKGTSTVFVATAATDPAAVTTSAFGSFAPSSVENDYNDVLPSLNLKFPLSKELVARLAVSRTMTRPDYSAIAGAFSLTPPALAGQVGTGTGSNPYIKPIRSNNLDVTLEYYFAPRSLVSASAFYMDLTSYQGLGSSRQSFNTIAAFTPTTGSILPYDITSPVNTSATVGGLELALDLPLGANFGVNTNYTYVDAKDADGGPVVGASKNTGNISGYFENNMFNARLTYTYRSSFFSGLDRATAFTQDKVGNVAASLGYKINDNFSLSLDAHNLNNPKLKYYALNRDQPRSIYQNGRQYYLTFRAKM
jgi:iron complex outermembrane receptor protein